MKKILILLVCLGLSGCAFIGSATKTNSVSTGMSKEDVIKAMGEPASTAAIEGKEYLNYNLDETGTWGVRTPFFVCLQDGKVISFGRKGDFDSTKDPTQVIKIMGDVKSDEKINVQTGDSGGLEKKLKTLNKLLSDGLITKSEFNEQKKKLLNDYTNK